MKDELCIKFIVVIILELVLCQRRTPLLVSGEGRGGAGRDGTGLNRGVTSFKNSTLHHSNRYSSSVCERAGGLGGCETCLTAEINNGTEWKHIGIQRKKDRGEK